MALKYIASEWKEQLEEAINSSLTMTEAYKKLGLERKTFKRMAEELGIYQPNRSGKGTHKNMPVRHSMDDILSNKVPYQSHKLKLRLIKEGYKIHKCEQCGRITWLGNPIPLELNHIDGNHENNELSNLELLCPNCHALTDTYRAKNIPNKKCVETT